MAGEMCWQSTCSPLNGVSNILCAGPKQGKLGAEHMQRALLAGWYDDMWLIQLKSQRTLTCSLHGR